MAGVLWDFHVWVRLAVDVVVAPGGGAFEDFAVRGEREQRPGVAIDVVFQVENLRETGAGGFLLGPGAVGVLRADQILDAAFERGIVRVAERTQAHDGPGGLRRGAWPAALENRVVVSVATLAPAAVLVLHAFQPVARF